MHRCASQLMRNNVRRIGRSTVSDELQAALLKAREKYSDLIVLRAAVQAVPYIGGPIDTLLAGGIGRIQIRRVEDFVAALDKRMNRVEGVSANLEDEAFADLLASTLEKVTRARSRIKRARYAAIITNQMVRADPWEEPETAVRLLADLEDIHLDVLRISLQPSPSRPEAGNRRLVDLLSPGSQDERGGLHLLEELPDYSAAALRGACAELTARGLLLDAGAGMWGVMLFFSPTELAVWFTEWLSEPPA